MPESAAAHDATPPAAPRSEEEGVPGSSSSHAIPEDTEAISSVTDDDDDDYSGGYDDDEDDGYYYEVGHDYEVDYQIVRDGGVLRTVDRRERQVPNAVPYGNLKKTVIEADAEDRACAICLEDMDVGSEVCALECMHEHHEPCILRWLEINPSCPLCRRKI